MPATLAQLRYLDQAHVGQADQTPGLSRLICNDARGGDCGLVDSPWLFPGCRSEEARYNVLCARI